MRLQLPSAAHREVGLLPLVLKTAVVHTVTYFIAGVIAMNLLDYGEAFASADSMMRPITDPWVMAGPLLQPIRGIIFGLALYPVRRPLFDGRTGWLKIWWLLVALGVLSTIGPAPGSIEAMIYTRQEVSIATYVEVVLQALALSILLYLWVSRPRWRWLSWAMGIAFVIVMALPTLGLLVSG